MIDYKRNIKYLYLFISYSFYTKYFYKIKDLYNWIQIGIIFQNIFTYIQKFLQKLENLINFRFYFFREFL